MTDDRSLSVGRVVTWQTNNETLTFSAADPVRGGHSGRSRPTGVLDVDIHAYADSVVEVRSVPLPD